MTLMWLPKEILIRIANIADTKTRLAFKRTCEWINREICAESARIASLFTLAITDDLMEDPYLTGLFLERDYICPTMHDEVLEMAICEARPDVVQWLSRREVQIADLRLARKSKGWWAQELSDHFYYMQIATNDEGRMRETIVALIELLGKEYEWSIVEVFAIPEVDSYASAFTPKKWAIDWLNSITI